MRKEKGGALSAPRNGLGGSDREGASPGEEFFNFQETMIIDQNISRP